VLRKVATGNLAWAAKGEKPTGRKLTKTLEGGGTASEKNGATTERKGPSI